jgi:GNAT superfamily N-acetyltransferase
MWRRARDALRSRLVEDRTALVLRVDLTDPRHHVRPQDRATELFLEPFDARTLPRVIAVVARHEPWRVELVRQRYFEGSRGFVAVHRGDVVGYVLWVEGSDHPQRVVHSDLSWLGARPGRGELYVFDYFVLERARGLGSTFARLVQQRHAKMGFTAAYGWVLASNRAALWLYRTTGWTEVGRVVERRWLGRVARIDDAVYWLGPRSRRPIARLDEPAGGPTPRYGAFIRAPIWGIVRTWSSDTARASRRST